MKRFWIYLVAKFWLIFKQFTVDLRLGEIPQFFFSIFLPPTNEVWGKVMFLLMCVILFRGGGGLPPGGRQSALGVCHRGGSESSGSSHSGGGQTTPPPPQNKKSGQYASYWNAFLLGLFLFLTS